MEDKERIEYIMLEKQLSNTEFCAKANISPATLSHILGGRSRPSLAILRGVVMGFPDLNPEWVLLGTGDMYRSGGVASDGRNEVEADADGQSADVLASDESLGVFGVMGDMFASSASSPIYNKGMAERGVSHGRAGAEKQEKKQSQ